MSGLQILLYLSVLFFAVVVAAKMIRIALMPVHLRWDLYPIPHEKGKGQYGGSYFEEVDWWNKPNDFSLFSELKEMGKEIFFLHSVWEHNRPLWVFSFPFHIGMYSLIGFLFLLVLGAILGAAGIAVSSTSSSVPGVALHYLTIVLGALGWVLSIFGAFGLILSRAFSKDMQGSTIFSDYVNLVFLLAVFIAGFLSWVSADHDYAALRGFVQGLITFSPATSLPTITALQLWLAAGLLVYFPFTHMTHVFAKYFTYHSVRWEDEPNLPGSKLEKEIKKTLGYRVTWAAPHVKSGATWAEAATAGEQEDKDE